MREKLIDFSVPFAALLLIAMYAFATAALFAVAVIVAVIDVVCTKCFYKEQVPVVIRDEY